MNPFNGAEKVGIRDIETDKLIAVYPYKPSGTQEEIEKAVMDWYYTQSCSAESEMKKSYVRLSKNSGCWKNFARQRRNTTQ